jgi:hypothetical protein
MHKKEYEPGFGLQAFTYDRLVRERCHPMLLDLFQQIFRSDMVHDEEVRRAQLPVWERYK